MLEENLATKIFEEMKSVEESRFKLIMHAPSKIAKKPEKRRSSLFTIG
jgi:hypothetical protein